MIDKLNNETFRNGKITLHIRFENFRISGDTGLDHRNIRY